MCVLFALMTLAISASAAYAQVEWNLGIKGGVNIVSLKGDDVVGVESNTAFIVGAAVMAQLNKNFGIEVDILYARKGAKSEFFDVTFDLDYIEIPILAVGLLPVSETVDLMGFVGPAFSFNISADVDGEDIKDEVEGTDISAVFGAGAIFDIGSFKLTLEGRYTLGFVSIDKLEDDDVKNSAISVMAGFMFPLGGGG